MLCMGPNRALPGRCAELLGSRQVATWHRSHCCSAHAIATLATGKKLRGTELKLAWWQAIPCSAPDVAMRGNGPKLAWRQASLCMETDPALPGRSTRWLGGKQRLAWARTQPCLAGSISTLARQDEDPHAPDSVCYRPRHSTLRAWNGVFTPIATRQIQAIDLNPPT